MHEDASATWHEEGQHNGAALAELERRVQRLEEAVATLQDWHSLEERIVARLRSHLENTSASRPAAPVRGLEEPASAHPLPPRAALPPPQAPRRGWVLLEALRELATMIRLLTDVRYSLGWPTRLAVLVLLGAIALSPWWVPFGMIPLVGTLLDKLVCLLLAFFLFKILSWEVQRYRQVRGEVRRTEEWSG